MPLRQCNNASPNNEETKFNIKFESNTFDERTFYTMTSRVQNA
jgi:hypothetical protein